MWQIRSEYFLKHRHQWKQEIAKGDQITKHNRQQVAYHSISFMLATRRAQEIIEHSYHLQSTRIIRMCWNNGINTPFHFYLSRTTITHSEIHILLVIAVITTVTAVINNNKKGKFNSNFIFCFRLNELIPTRTQFYFMTNRNTIPTTYTNIRKYYFLL